VRFRVAAVQPGPEGLAPLLPLVDADLVLLPENWLSRKPVSYGEYASAARGVSLRVGAPVIAGAQYVDVNGTVKSVGVVATPDGAVDAVCEKVMPSRSVGERGKLARGRLRPPFEALPGLRVGCIVCVDIYYPEIARYHTLSGAHVIVNPASIPADRVFSWRSLLSARASENTVYAVGVNKTGTPYPDGRFTGGYTSAYAPDGEPEATLGPHPGVLTFTVNPLEIERVESRRGFRSDLEELARSGLYEWGPLGGRG